MFTIVGGLSNVKDVMCNEEPPYESEHKGTYMQHLLWCDASLDDIAPLAEEYLHEVLTHVGSSSLFLEHVTAMSLLRQGLHIIRTSLIRA
jgi:hypothetical protein